jgi:hypothetical protein
MTASHIRAALRKTRQKNNKDSLTTDQKFQNPQAVRSYIMHSGKRGKGTGGPFELFARYFPMSGEEAPPTFRQRISEYANDWRRALTAKLAHRKANRIGRKQRPYRFLGGKQSKPASRA